MLQQFAPRQRPTEQLVDGHRARHAARSGTAEAARERHLLVHAKTHARPIEETRTRAAVACGHEVRQDGLRSDSGDILRRICGEESAVASHLDDFHPRCIRQFGVDDVAGSAEGEAEDIEAGSEVAGAGWSKNANRRNHRPASCADGREPVKTSGSEPTDTTTQDTENTEKMHGGRRRGRAPIDARTTDTGAAPPAE